jgi:hypothetical protein
MQQELASISEVVWLSAPDALDRAASQLASLGYDTTHRSDYHLTAQRLASTPSAEQDTYMLTVSASPQAGGGVRGAIKGDEREGMEEHREEWANWASSLPKKGSTSAPGVWGVRWKDG